MDSFPPLEYTQETAQIGGREAPRVYFAGRTLSALDGRGAFWFAHSREYRLYKRSLEGDTLLVVELDAEPAAVAEADVQAVREYYANRPSRYDEDYIKALPEQRVEMFKYLGVLLSHDLSWGEHVQAICSKARKILGLLYRRFYNNTPSSTLLQLYISLVRPHLDYASAIWSPYLTKDKIELENIQKFACRMATGLWDTSYQDLELVDLPTLECQRLENPPLSTV